jgi:rRNA maturation RNase YbeY
LADAQSEDEMNLGDIYISVPYVKKWCKDHNVDIHERLPILYAHGICHLLGYDHQEEDDYATVRDMLSISSL